MKTEKQIKRKRKSLLQELKELRTFTTLRRSRGFDVSHYQFKEGKLMGQISSLDWVTKIITLKQ